MPQRRPNIRTAAMAAIARRELSLTTLEVGDAIGKSATAVLNLETDHFAMSEESERRLLEHYLDEFARRGVTTGPRERLPLPQVVERVASAVLQHRVLRAHALLAAFDRGADEIVTALISEYLQARRIVSPKVALRIKARLEYERARALPQTEEADRRGEWTHRP